MKNFENRSVSGLLADLNLKSQMIGQLSMMMGDSAVHGSKSDIESGATEMEKYEQDVEDITAEIIRRFDLKK